MTTSTLFALNSCGAETFQKLSNEYKTALFNVSKSELALDKLKWKHENFNSVKLKEIKFTFKSTGETISQNFTKEFTELEKKMIEWKVGQLQLDLKNLQVISNEKLKDFKDFMVILADKDLKSPFWIAFNTETKSIDFIVRSWKAKEVEKRKKKQANFLNKITERMAVDSKSDQIQTNLINSAVNEYLNKALKLNVPIQQKSNFDKNKKKKKKKKKNLNTNLNTLKKSISDTNLKSNSNNKKTFSSCLRVELQSLKRKFTNYIWKPKVQIQADKPFEKNDRKSMVEGSRNSENEELPSFQIPKLKDDNTNLDDVLSGWEDHIKQDKIFRQQHGPSYQGFDSDSSSSENEKELDSFTLHYSNSNSDDELKESPDWDPMYITQKR